MLYAYFVQGEQYCLAPTVRDPFFHDFPIPPPKRAVFEDFIFQNEDC